MSLFRPKAEPSQGYSGMQMAEGASNAQDKGPEAVGYGGLQTPKIKGADHDPFADLVDFDQYREERDYYDPFAPRGGLGHGYARGYFDGYGPYEHRPWGYGGGVPQIRPSFGPDSQGGYRQSNPSSFQYGPQSQFYGIGTPSRMSYSAATPKVNVRPQATTSQLSVSASVTGSQVTQSTFTVSSVPIPSTGQVQSAFAPWAGNYFPNFNNQWGPTNRGKELNPESYDGSTDLNDYLAHFDQVANYNQWADGQKAQILVAKLKGQAQKVITSLSPMETSDYTSLKSALARFFNPKELEMAHRSVYKNRRCKNDESVAQFGFELRRLAQKAYPNAGLAELEIHIIDQYLEGLGDHELRKHVQLHHPQTLSQAIGLATEYCSVDNPKDKLLKPNRDKIEVCAISDESPCIVNSLRPLKYQTEVSSEELEKLVTSLVEQRLKNINKESGPSDRPPTPNKNYQGPRGKAGDKPAGGASGRGGHNRNQGGRPPRQERKDIICHYCNKKGHVEARCWEKQDQNQGN